MQKVHVQWLNHSSKTILQEIHDPQELFLQHLCHDIPMKSVIAPVRIHRLDCTPDSTNPIPFGEFYYK
jgi:DNA (cytosine-5)-methyltransferase 1